MSILKPSGGPEEGGPATSAELQFEQAEYDEAVAPSLACCECKQEITGEYYLINGGYFCSSCRWAREGSIEPERSALGGLLRAALYGSGAVAVGTAIYFGISWATGYEFGLIAVVVGWMVGKAVLRGSGNRGGRAYQTLAVFLTYCAIVLSYVPSIITAIEAANQEQQQQSELGQAEATAAGDPAEPGAEAAAEATSDPIPVEDGLPADQEPPPAESTPTEAIAIASEAADSESVTAGELAIGITFIFLIVLAAPFLAGWENIMGLVIIGIGLYEAWRHSARRDDRIEGPFTAGAPPSPAPETASV